MILAFQQTVIALHLHPPSEIKTTEFKNRLEK